MFNRTLHSLHSAKSTPNLNLTSAASRYRSESNLCNSVERSPASGGIGQQLKYLKVLCALINEHLADIGVSPPNKVRWQIRDFDTMTSDQMLRIVVYLTRGFNMQKVQVEQYQPLERCFELGMGNLNYQSGIDETYHKIKGIFPEGSDLFHYSVLLLPSLNPKRTREVLVYICRLHLFADEVMTEHLQPCYDQIVRENEEKGQLCREIDDIKDKTSELIQKREVNILSIPTLQSKLDKLRKTNEDKETVLIEKQQKAKREEVIYREHEQKGQLLQQKLESLKLEISRLGNELVENPKLIKRELQQLKIMYDNESQERMELACKTDQINAEITALAELCKNIDDIQARFAETNSALDNLKDLKESIQASSEGMCSKKQKINHAIRKVDHLKRQHLKELQKNNQHAACLEQELKILQDDYQKGILELPKLKSITTAEKSVLFDIHESILEAQDELTKLQEAIAEVFYILGVLLPARYEYTTIHAENLLAEVFESFEHNPILTINVEVDENS